MRITAISDTHGRHLELDDKYFPGGDLLIHTGDFLEFAKYKSELRGFCTWYELFDNYQKRILVAGNHDLFMDNYRDDAEHILTHEYRYVDYLEDDWISYTKSLDESVKIMGSPWTFKLLGESVFTHNRGSKEMKRRWDILTNDIDILVTHSPPQGILDNLFYHDEDVGNIGCEFLAERVKEIKPKIHIFGHCHGENTYHFDGTTHYINAALMDDKFFWYKDPITFDWNVDTNEIEFV